MADFMRVKYENPKPKQSEIANKLRSSSSTLQRYTNDIYIRFHRTEFTQITPINEQKSLNILILTLIHTVNTTSKDLKFHQMTSKDLKRLQMKIVRK